MPANNAPRIPMPPTLCSCRANPCGTRVTNGARQRLNTPRAKGRRRVKGGLLGPGASRQTMVHSLHALNLNNQATVGGSKNVRRGVMASGLGLIGRDSPGCVRQLGPTPLARRPAPLKGRACSCMVRVGRRARVPGTQTPTPHADPVPCAPSPMPHPPRPSRARPAGCRL